MIVSASKVWNASRTEKKLARAESMDELKEKDMFNSRSCAGVGGGKQHLYSLLKNPKENTKIIFHTVRKYSKIV